MTKVISDITKSRHYFIDIPIRAWDLGLNLNRLGIDGLVV